MTVRSATAAIRFHAGRGMSRDALERIYGRDRVLRVLGGETVKPVPRVTLGGRLRAARLAKGDSLHAACVAIGCGHARSDDIEAYELGTKAIKSPERIARIAAYIGVPLADIRRDLEEHNEKAAAHRRMPDRPPKPDREPRRRSEVLR